MRLGWFALIGVLAGCGRIGFDEGDIEVPDEFEAWSQHQRVRVTSPADETLVDFVLPLFVRAPFDYAQAANDGGDLRITDESGALLDHEIELWTTGGTSVVWVRIPKLEPGVQLLLVHAGNPAAPALGTKPWTTDHVAVFHFGGDANDATSNESGFSVDTTFVAGFAGKSMHLSQAGPPSYGGVLTASGLDEVHTWSGWINTDVMPIAGQYVSLVVRPVPTESVNSPYLGLLADTLYFETFDDSGDFISQQVPGLVAGSWFHLAMTEDAGAIRIFVDGIERGSWTLSSGAFPKPQAGLFFGSDCDSCGNDPTVANGDFLEGAIDEIRLERAVRSPAWIATQDAAMRDKLAIFE